MVLRPDLAAAIRKALLRQRIEAKRWWRLQQAGPFPGALYVVATPIGNLDDLSARAIETLKRCRLILAEDTRHSKRLLRAFGIETPMRSYHEFNERKRAEEIVAEMGEVAGDVALISDAGTPCISDPGYRLVRAARERRIPVFGVSGPSALVTALSISGLPSDRFAFHGFPPRKRKEREAFLARLGAGDYPTHVVYESPKRVLPLVGEIAEAYPEAVLCVCTELTKLHEKSFFGCASEVREALAADPHVTRGEYTIVVHLPRAEAAGSGADPARFGTGVDDSRASLDGERLLCREARLVDRMVKEQVTLKEAIAALAKEEGGSRSEYYAAGIRLRELLQLPS